MNKTIIYGIAGSGKTAKIIELIRTRHPDRLGECCVISFSRSAVRNLRERIGVNNAKEEYDRKDLEGFRTIHSICSRLMELSKEIFLTEGDIEKFMEQKHIDFKQEDELYDEQSDGQRLLSLIDYIRHTQVKSIDNLSARDLHLQIGYYLAQYGHFDKIIADVQIIRDLIQAYEDYKKEIGKLDYTDILLLYLSNPVQTGYKVLVVDEFQDMSPLIYKIIKTFEQGADYVYYAGDPNQAIYTWMGADPHFLIDEIKDADEEILLNKSHRVADKVYVVAKDTINSNSRDKIDFEIECVNKGDVKRISEDDVVSIAKTTGASGTTYILARTNWMKRRILKALMQEGVEFSEISGNKVWTIKLINITNALLSIKNGTALKIDWLKAFIDVVPSKPYLKHGVKKNLKEQFKDKQEVEIKELYGAVFDVKHNPAEFLSGLETLKVDKDRVNIIRNKIARSPSLIPEKPPISVGTIHSAKGLEADNVILNLNLSAKIQRGLTNKTIREAEARIFYVAFTRSKSDVWVYGHNQILKGV